MIVTGPDASRERRNRPTAAALRRQPAITVAPPPAAAGDADPAAAPPAATAAVATAAQIAEPFGDGRTSLGVNGARRSAAGDSDHGAPDLRPPASWARCFRANPAASSCREPHQG